MEFICYSLYLTAPYICQARNRKNQIETLAWFNQYLRSLKLLSLCLTLYLTILFVDLERQDKVPCQNPLNKVTGCRSATSLIVFLWILHNLFKNIIYAEAILDRWQWFCTNMFPKMFNRNSTDDDIIQWVLIYHTKPCGRRGSKRQIILFVLLNRWKTI